MPASKGSKDAIGFPTPLLGEVPRRIGVLASGEGWLALDKPAGIGMRAHPWDAAPDLDSALNLQLEAGKPELRRTGAEMFGSVYYLDPAISGVALFATDRESMAELRNRFGSSECRFSFQFVAAAGGVTTAEFGANAPLLPHRVKPKMIPSTAKGKKSATFFRRIANSDLGWGLWEAGADYFRIHQIRAHAATHGIPVLGDSLYDGPAAPTLRQLDPRARRSDLDSAVFAGMGIHLARVKFPDGERWREIESPLPKAFSLLLKRLKIFGSDSG